MRLTIEIDFPKDRKEYTDIDGRVWKLTDYKHWEQWLWTALWAAPDNALTRCGAKINVQHNPKPEPFRVHCPKCGDYGEVIIKGACDVEIPVRRYPADSAAPGYVVPDWEGAYVEDLRDGEYEYVCSECENKIFDNIEQVKDYLKVHEEAKNGSLEP